MTESHQRVHSTPGGISVQRGRGGIVIVSVVGDLRADTAVALWGCVGDELMECPTMVMVDLSGVRVVDATAVNALADAAALADDHDIGFCLAGVRSDRVHRVLAVAQLTDLIASVDSPGLIEPRRHTHPWRRQLHGWPSHWTP
jgi:anti-anti-sigma factor